ncbi:MAG: tRNA (N6-threonylcarbamoyladenosine(37)-N6)-methyltransferase TrmO [Proteobacteria bacterium]|nr:tRNA (N6-threonylcarbamoyladenosine(37)-N6)-methyltransferase TrmO [Pseudomonadota bacterium]
MVRRNEIRPGERAVDLPPAYDASLYFIGRIRTPWSDRLDCPRQGRFDGPQCRLEIDARWQEGLDSIEEFARLEVLYWLHQSRRDLVHQSPRNGGRARGVFSLRTPVRPNPIGTAIVKLERVEGAVLFVRGLDCLDGTPLIDVKPDRTLFEPPAPPRKGDFQVGDA